MIKRKFKSLKTESCSSPATGDQRPAASPAPSLIFNDQQLAAFLQSDDLAFGFNTPQASQH